MSTQDGIKIVYVGHIVAWFCFLFMVYSMNYPQGNVSAVILAVLSFFAIYSLVVGSAMRKKLFKRSFEAAPNNPGKAVMLWRGANFVGFSCAISVTVCGTALKILGGGWLISGMFFGVSLGFLLLWRPRQLPLSDAQPT